MVTKEQLDEYTRAYSNGTPLMSDEEYDVLMEEYVRAHGEESRPFLRQKQSDDVNDLVGTLPKEEWKPCKSNDDKFNGQFISSRGNFKDGDKIVPSYHSTNGHLYCLYRFSGLNVKLIPVESVVVSYFGKHFNINNKHVVHNDGNRSNNTIENLTVIDDIEIWKEVDYPDIQKDRYIISNTGYVKNRITGKILTNCIGQNGYKYVYIKTINGQHKGVLLHRLIATSFVPNPDPKRYNIVNHLDGCPCNNSIINLEWCDQKINSQHAAYTQHMTKLSIQDIDMIRSMLLDKGNRGSASKIYELLKDEYPHISKSQIYAIKHNMCYKRSYTYTDVTDIKYPKYECDNIPTDDIDMIRDMLLSDEYKFSVAAVYKALDHDRYP